VCWNLWAWCLIRNTALFYLQALLEVIARRRTGRVYVTNYMRQNWSWKPNKSETGEGFHCFLVNSNFHYPLQKSLPLNPVLRKMNPAHIPTHYFFRIQFNIILPFTLRCPTCYIHFKTSGLIYYQLVNFLASQHVLQVPSISPSLNSKFS
jgi:hypothetical protein